MRFLELCALTDSRISDLWGLMKERNAELTVAPEMQRRAVGALGTRIVIVVGCATLCVYESPTGRKASVEDVVASSAYWSQGIGRTLLQLILDFAGSKLSPIDIHLTSNPSRTKANAFYQALGFEQRDTNVYKMSL